MQVSEESICKLLKKQDPKGLEYLFDLYYRPLVLWADTFTNNMLQAEDTVQDFFVKIWEKELYKGFEAGKVKTYLYTSIRHMALNRIGKKDPLRQAYDINSFSTTYEEYDNTLEDYLNRIEGEVDKLPQRSREVMKAVYFDGQPYKVVADRYGISVSTVKTLLVNSLRKIRENSKNLPLILFLFFRKKVRFLFNRF